MRSLILVFAYFWAPLSAVVSLAGATSPRDLPKIPASNFSIAVRGEYATRYAIVYRDGPDWICTTEDIPYFVAPKNPLAGLDWKKLESDARANPPGDCRNEVIVDDHRTSPRKVLRSCLAAPAFSALNRRLNHICRVE